MAGSEDSTLEHSTMMQRLLQNREVRALNRKIKLLSEDDVKGDLQERQLSIRGSRAILKDRLLRSQAQDLEIEHLDVPWYEADTDAGVEPTYTVDTCTSEDEGVKSAREKKKGSKQKKAGDNPPSHSSTPLERIQGSPSEDAHNVAGGVGVSMASGSTQDPSAVDVPPAGRVDDSGVGSAPTAQQFIMTRETMEALRRDPSLWDRFVPQPTVASGARRSSEPLPLPGAAYQLPSTIEPVVHVNAQPNRRRNRRVSITPSQADVDLIRAINEGRESSEDSDSDEEIVNPENNHGGRPSSRLQTTPIVVNQPPIEQLFNGLSQGAPQDLTQILLNLAAAVQKSSAEPSIAAPAPASFTRASRGLYSAPKEGGCESR